MTSSHDDQQSVHLASSSGSVSLRTTIVVPEHGSGAATAGPAHVHASTHAPLGLPDAVLAAVRIMCSLGGTAPVGMQVIGGQEVRVGLDQPWRDAALLIESLLSDATTVQLLVPGQSRGELEWTLTKENCGLRVELRAVPGVWYEQVLRLLPHAVVHILDQAATAPDRLVCDLDG